MTASFLAFLLAFAIARCVRDGNRLVLAFFVCFLTLTITASGCCSTERSGETLTLRIRRDRPPATACDYRFLLDGKVQMRGALAQCPVAPVCEEPR